MPDCGAAWAKRMSRPRRPAGGLGSVVGVSAQPGITQRDLRNRSKEIMDAVQNGQAFTVTRDGHRIGELIPLRRRRRFVPRAEFSELSRSSPDISLDAFREDQDVTAEQAQDDRHAG
ncbi:hypothetical protein SCYAM73S_01257 [Streptomyces cyaneofuscatus]